MHGMNAGGMSTKRTQQPPAPTGLLITLLALIALIGLLTGLLTRTLISRSAATGPATTTSATSAGSRTPTAPPSTTPATATTSTTGVTAQFQLSVSVSPKKVSPGQQITITIHAFTPDTHAPVSGLSCILRAPADGSPSLLTAFPGAQMTDADGATSWTLTAPSEAAGQYEVEAFAQASKWSWKADSTVTMLAS